MMIFISLLAASFLTTCGTRPQEGATSPSHYVYFGRDHERMLESMFLEHPGIDGAQVKYMWRQLEPERDTYDFADIHDQLELLQRYDKRLFLQISDVSFTQRPPVPEYLLTDPAFHGGAAQKFEGDSGVFDGWVARRWDPAVRERFALLLQALAEEFDGQLEGINLPETAIGFENPKYHPPGFAFDVYAEGMLDMLSNARAAFNRSCVTSYANFMPGESLPEVDNGYLKGIYELAEKIGVGVGGPDLLPHRRGQQNNSLPLIAARSESVVAGLAVQDGNLEEIDPATGKPVTVDALYRYASDVLRLDYIFWGIQEPFYSRDILPFLAGLVPDR